MPDPTFIKAKQDLLRSLCVWPQIHVDLWQLSSTTSHAAQKLKTTNFASFQKLRNEIFR